jgi:hypothetical protein
MIGTTALSRYYDVCYIGMLLITIPNLSSQHDQIIEIHTGYNDSLDILIHFPYPNSIVITRVYCTPVKSFWFKHILYLAIGLH